MNDRMDPASVPHEKIRQRAYERFVARGREPGRALEDWIAAEAELAAATPTPKTPVSDAPSKKASKKTFKS